MTRSRWWRLIPRGPRHALIRRAVTYDESVREGVTVEVACTHEAYRAALSLVHDSYLERGWIERQKSGMWLTPQHTLVTTTVFVLWHNDACLGTVSLTEDTPAGLPIDLTYGEEMRRLRPRARKVAEIGSLALAKGARRSGLFLVLIAALWRYARHRLSVTDLVIAIDPDMADYYDAIFSFRRFTEVSSYEGFGDARHRERDPIIGLHHNVEHAMRVAPGHWAFAPSGHFTVWSLVREAFPAAYELYPPVLSDRELARYKLPREVLAELIANTELHERFDLATKAELKRTRSTATFDWVGLSRFVPGPRPDEETEPT